MRNVKISSIILVLTMFPLLIPDGIVYMLGIENRAMLLIRGIDLIVLVFLIIIRKSKLSILFILLISIYSTMLFSAYIHGHSRLISFLSGNFHGLVMCVAFEYWLNNYFVKTIRFLKNTIWILILINLFLIICFPNGLYAATYKFSKVTLANHLTYDLNWLFGYKNNQFGIVFPFLAIYCVYRICICGKFKNTSIFVFLICILEEFMAQATMSFLIVTFFTISVFTIFYKNSEVSRFISKFYNIKSIIFVAAIIVLGIIGVSTNSVLENALTQVSIELGKGTSFNGRSAIWLVAINYIKESPIIGYGSIDSEDFIEKSRILGGTNAHNFILHLLVSGGLICFSEYAILYGYVIRFLRRNKCIISSIIGIVIGMCFVDGITSICLYYPFFNAVFLLAYYAVCFYYRNNLGKDIA